MGAMLLFTQFSLKPRLWLYPVIRQVVMAKLAYDTRDRSEFYSEHFLIKYTADEADQVALVAAASEAAYHPVTELLGYTPGRRAVIYLYSHSGELKRRTNGSGDETDMGAYYRGVMQIVTPDKWLKQDDQAATLAYHGPITHEFTHLVLDYQTNGNYSRWFTEGVAQYAEYKINHYEWITPANRLSGKLYTLAELDEHFADLPNQALAYREALAAVRFITENFGESALRQINDQLAQGIPLKAAILETLGLTYNQYEAGWQLWARDYLEEH